MSAHPTYLGYKTLFQKKTAKISIYFRITIEEYNPLGYNPLRKSVYISMMGRRQVVRPRVLIPVFAGSNPAVPAKPQNTKSYLGYSSGSAAKTSSVREVSFPSQQL